MIDNTHLKFFFQTASLQLDVIVLALLQIRKKCPITFELNYDNLPK